MAAKSLVLQDSVLVTFEILVNGQAVSSALQITSISVQREANRIPQAKIIMVDGGVAEEEEFSAANSNDFIPGSEIKIKAGYSNQNQDIFEGIVIKHSCKVSRKGSPKLIIECREKSVKMTIGRKNAVFVEKKDDEIIKSILSDYRISNTVDTCATKHEQLVQHYTSDWDFILLRAEVNGLLVLPGVERLKIIKPELSANPKYTVAYGITLLESNLFLDARSQYSEVNAYSWDDDSQKMNKAKGDPPAGGLGGNLESRELAEVSSPSEFILQTSTVIPKDMLNIWASAKMTKSALARIQGEILISGVDDLDPGDIIEVENLSARFNGKLFVRGLEHNIQEGNWTTRLYIGMSDDWFSESQMGINSPDTSGLAASFKGLTTGIVQRIHEDPAGKFRVQIFIPALGEDSEPVWARMSNFSATKNAGMFFYPEIEDEVLVGFLNEDPQSPVILGKLYNQKAPPPYTPSEENENKAIVTKNKLEIHFEDEKKIITIKTPAGNEIILNEEDKLLRIQDQNDNSLEMSDSGILINSPQDITITAEGKIDLTATADITLKATGDLKGEGMEVGLKGSTKFAAEGAMAEIKGSAQTTIKGGMVMIN